MDYTIIDHTGAPLAERHTSDLATAMSWLFSARNDREVHIAIREHAGAAWRRMSAEPAGVHEDLEREFAANGANDLAGDPHELAEDLGERVATIRGLLMRNGRPHDRATLEAYQGLYESPAAYVERDLEEHIPPCLSSLFEYIDLARMARDWRRQGAFWTIDEPAGGVHVFVGQDPRAEPARPLGRFYREGRRLFYVTGRGEAFTIELVPRVEPVQALPADAEGIDGRAANEIAGTVHEAVARLE